MALGLFKQILVLVRGGGDLGSGVIYRLHRVGFPIVITELPAPKLVRRTVSYGEAVFSGTITVEGVTARRVNDIEDCCKQLEHREIPVIVDDTKSSIIKLRPVVVVDARMEKTQLDTTLDDAPLVIALGPGYKAGIDCHAVIETNRGHNLGRVIWHGIAEPDTGVPSDVKAQNLNRVLRAPADGYVQSEFRIGDMIEAGQTIGYVSGHPFSASFRGILRGLIHSSVYVKRGMKIGDLDPRSQYENCFTISDKSLAVGGGVLEAVLSAPLIDQYLRTSCYETL